MRQQQTTAARRSAPTELESPNAIELLKSQHREVEALFTEYEKLGSRARKKKEAIFEAIADNLTAHTKIEEAIFYPAAKEASDDLVLEAFEEHANIKTMIRKLHRTEAGDETFDAKMTVLKELISHHVKEEENELFPKCQDVLEEDTLIELGERMQKKFETIKGAH